MDPNEEFEFKPLTEGLGFHSKKVDLASEVKKSKLLSEMISNKIIKEVPATPIMAFEENHPDSEKMIKPTLPRITVPESDNEIGRENVKGKHKGSGSSAGVRLGAGVGTTTGAVATTGTVAKKDVIDELIESFKKPAKSFVEDKKTDVIFDKISVEEKRNGIKTAWALAPFLVDLMMVAAFFLIGLIIALSITKVDIIDFVLNAKNNIENLLVLPAILFMMIFMYSILTRLFIGGTLGEMVFDMQLGSLQEQKSAFYGIKVLGRLLLVILTGMVTLPLLSWIFRSDFSGKILKLQLVKKK